MDNSGISSRLPSGLSALRERNFVLYLVGQLTSQLGHWIEVTAVNWILYEMTGSPLLLGLNGLFRAVPTIFLTLYGGVVADRVQRRRLLAFTESTLLVASLALGMLVVTGQLQVWHLYLLSVLTGTLSAFSGPTRHALMAGLVPRASMQSAVTLHVLSLRVGMLIGPSIAGLALAFGGNALPFFVNAASFFVMLLALRAMRLPPIAVKPDVDSASPSVSSRVAEGLRFVRKMPMLKAALGLEIMTGLFGYNSTLITIFAHDVLRAGPQGLGLMFSALGAGALLGMAVMLGFRVARHGPLILFLGVFYVVLWAAFGLSSWLWLTAFLLFWLGAADGMWSVTRSTLAHLSVSDELRGRVMSVVMLTTRGSNQVGHLQSGALVSLVGPPAAALVGALIIGITLAGAARALYEPNPKHLPG